MNIEITKDQYETLLKLIYCGDWVLNSYKTKEDKAAMVTDKFEQYIFSFAKEFKLEKWIEYDAEEQRYFPTEAMEDALFKYIVKYNDKQR